MEHPISIFNRFLAFIIIAVNLYLIPSTLETILNDGGPMGFGYMALSFIFPVHIVLIFSILTFRKKSQNSTNYLLLNSLTVLYILGLLFPAVF